MFILFCFSRQIHGWQVTLPSVSPPSYRSILSFAFGRYRNIRNGTVVQCRPFPTRRAEA